MQQIDRIADVAESPRSLSGSPAPLAVMATSAPPLHAARRRAAPGVAEPHGEHDAGAAGLVAMMRDAAAGNRSAHDALGDHFYRRGLFALAALHYSEALIGELYRQHPQLTGPRSLLSMHRRGLIAPGSKAHAVADHLARQQRATQRRVRVTAALAGSVGAVGGWLGSAALTKLGLVPASAGLDLVLPALLALGGAAAAHAAAARRRRA